MMTSLQAGIASSKPRDAHEGAPTCSECGMLMVPNGACYAALRPLLTSPLAPLAREWLAQNNLLGFPYRFGFTPSSLDRVLTRLGFTVERVVGDVLVPIGDDWTKRWARVEERIVKRVGTLVARTHVRDRVMAPWIEGYARVG